MKLDIELGFRVEDSDLDRDLLEEEKKRLQCEVDHLEQKLLRSFRTQALTELREIIERYRSSPGEGRIFLTEDAICDMGKDSGTSHRYCIMGYFEDMFKVFKRPEGKTCHEIGDLLDSLMPDDGVADHESSCNYWNFKTRRAALTFIKRANTALNQEAKKSA